MTLLELLSRAGGVPTSGAAGSVEGLADLRHSFLIRKGQFVPVDFYRLMHEGNLSQNIFLQPDDFVYVPPSTSREIYVLGAVLQPHAIPYAGDMMTLVSAMAAVGGPRPEAYQSHVAVVRGSLTRPMIAVVNYRDIVRGKAPDVRLEPRDIVYVPNSPYDVLERYARYITDSFVRTVAVNAGYRIYDTGQSVTPSVPIQ
jgi:protein involved in polysaccharide export with SLBB domain